jgi:hypothetical protein
MYGMTVNNQEFDMRNRTAITLAFLLGTVVGFVLGVAAILVLAVVVTAQISYAQ